MSQPPGYGPAPPARGGSKNLIIAIIAVVVVAAAVIVAIVVLSGKDDTPTASQPTQTLTGSPIRPSSSASVPNSSAGPSGGTTVTCPDIAGSSLLKGKLTLTPGGTKPSGVPLPAGTPSLICSGDTHVTQAAHVTAMAWPGLSQSSYLHTLTKAGWTDNTATPPFHVLGKQGAKYQIVTIEIKGSLVAIFGPS